MTASDLFAVVYELTFTDGGPPERGVVCRNATRSQADLAVGAFLGCAYCGPRPGAKASVVAVPMHELGRLEEAKAAAR